LARTSTQTVDSTLSGFFGVFRYSRQALTLVLTTSRWLTLSLAVLTVIAGAVPGGIALVGSHLVDAVVSRDIHRVLHFVMLEGALVAAMAGAQRGLSMCQ
jgi:ATP-binding cassette subfamily B protein